MDKTIADLEWKSTFKAKNKVLEAVLTNQGFTITTGRLHCTKLEKQLKTLDTKVDTMFTPLRDAFEYQHIIQQFNDQCDTDKETAKYNSMQRSDIIANQIKKNEKFLRIHRRHST